jgi:Ni,Fe-hydrogenase III component G
MLFAALTFDLPDPRRATFLDAHYPSGGIPLRPGATQNKPMPAYNTHTSLAHYLCR